MNHNFISNTENLKYYAGTMLASLVGFSLVYALSHQLLVRVLKPETYLRFDSNLQADYLSRITAVLHGIIGFYFARQAVSDNCPSGKSILEDDECFCKPGPDTVMVGFLSLGWVVYDLYIVLFHIKDLSALGLQNIAHHVIAILAMTSSMFSPSYAFSATAGTVYTEMSTIFLHLRYFFVISKNAESLTFLALMCVFIATFFYSRVYILNQVAYKFFTIHETCTTKFETNVGDTSSGFLELAYLMMALMCLLNLYWGSIIVHGVYSVITGGLGNMKIGSRDADLAEEIELKTKSV